MYRVSHFWHLRGISFIFKDGELRTKDGGSNIFMDLLVFEIHSETENYYFLDAPCVSIIIQIGNRFRNRQIVLFIFPLRMQTFVTQWSYYSTLFTISKKNHNIIGNS